MAKKKEPKRIKLEMTDTAIRRPISLNMDETIPTNPVKKPKKMKKSKKELFDDVLIYTKSTLKKILKGMPMDREVDFFQHSGMSTIVIFDHAGKELKSYRGSRKTKWLKDVEKKWPDAQVLVPIREGYLKMIPVRTLAKLSKISKMVLTHEITMLVDGDDEPFVLERSCHEITEVSQLLAVLLKESIWIDAIVKMSGDVHWYTTFETIHTAMVELKDGTKLHYDDMKDTDSFVDFLTKFGLDFYLSNID